MPLNLELPERVDHANSAAVLADLAGQLSSFGKTEGATLDLSGLRTFDSSALSVLLGLTRVAHNQSLVLTWSGWPPKLLDLVEAYGLRPALLAHTD